MELREEYITLEPELHRGVEAGAIAEDLKPKLQAMRRKVEAVSFGLERRKGNVQGMPNSTLSQLRSVSLTLRSIERSDFGKQASRLDRVHTHIGLALTYAILWGQQGFR